MEYVLISVKTKKAEARKKHTGEWPEAVNGENSGDQANVCVKLAQVDKSLWLVPKITLCN